jgi:hypothetical protein
MVDNGVIAMAVVDVIGSRILEEVAKTPGLSIDDIVTACPHLSWNQIFLEIDHLSRIELITLKLEGTGRYRIWPTKASRGGHCRVERKE